MKASFLSIADSFKVEFSLADLPRLEKVRLLRKLMDETGVTPIIFADDDLTYKIDLKCDDYIKG